MRKSTRDKQLPVIFFGKFYGNMFAICRTSSTNIHSNIQNSSFNTTH